MSDSPRDVIGKALPKSWSQTKRDGIADQIADALDTAGLLLWDGTTAAVEVRGARVTVETIAAYGLDIEIDANGNAGRIASDRGLVIA